MIGCTCGALLPEGKRQCPKCGKWLVSREEVDATLQRTVCLADVEASDVARIRTGPWDVAFGGGIVRDTVILLAGQPGQGKSTLVLQIGSAVAELEQKNVLYIAKEESAGQIKSRAERLQMPPQSQRRFTVVPHFDKPIGELLDEHESGLVILDSLPALAGTGPAGMKPAYEILEQIREYTLRKIVPVIVIDHINKEGDFAGQIAWQHLVDVTLMLEGHVRDDDHVVTRLGAVKNRHGASAAFADFFMTEHGLVQAPPEGMADSEDEKDE